MSTDNPTPNTGDGRDRAAELLSRALNEEAAMVHTDPSALHEIQQRTQKPSHPRRPWIYAGVGAAAATAAVLVGVAVLGDHTQDSSGGPAATGKSTTSAPTTAAVQTQPVDVTVTYLGAADNDYRLVTEQHSVEAPQGVSGPLLALKEFLDAQPADSDYSSSWPTGVEAPGVSTSSHSVQVDLTGPAGALDSVDPSYSAAGRELAVQALFINAGGQPGDTGTVTYNGQQLSAALGVQLPVTVASDDATRAWISIDNVTDGQTMTNPVSVQVSGNVFEGNVNWQLLDDAGTKLDEGFVTTTMGQRAQASIDLGTLDPGTYTIRCLEYSPKDGKPGNVDDKTFTVN